MIEEVVFTKGSIFSNFPKKYSFVVIGDLHVPFLTIRTDLAVK